jgi:hypothetical protein
MKLIAQVFVSLSIIFISCVDPPKNENQTAKNPATLKSSISMHPNELFHQNCAMCHGYNQAMTAPAMNRYSVDSILNFYDGKTGRDSLWLRHRKILITRAEWKRIAIQMQPGDYLTN